MRRLIAFPCAGETLVGTLDPADGSTGVLIVSGGNELRIGAHRGMAELAGKLASVGIPVFRFDRRGIGDSTGDNAGFENAGPDIAAALAAFRREQSGLSHVVGFGNCDAASALALFGGDLDALVLANPWIGGVQNDLPPPAAIRARYASRLRDPRQWRRLVMGKIDLMKLIRGLKRISSDSSQQPTDLASRLAQALAADDRPLTLLLARDDNTAIAFRDAWERPAFAATRARAETHMCDTASHSFATGADKAWLFDRLCAAVDQFS